MTPVEWFALLAAFFQFPKELLAVAKLLKGTPEEHRQAILAGAQRVSDELQATGRPTW